MIENFVNPCRENQGSTQIFNKMKLDILLPTIPSILASTGDAGSVGKIGGIAALGTAIIIVYLLGVVGIGLYAGHLVKKKFSSGESRDYFLAGGSLKWPLIGLALFATKQKQI